jgi:hypothetical protein
MELEFLFVDEITVGGMRSNAYPMPPFLEVLRKTKKCPDIASTTGNHDKNVLAGQRWDEVWWRVEAQKITMGTIPDPAAAKESGQG